MEVTFDETFGNIQLNAQHIYTFSNPIEPKYNSATVQSDVRGVISLFIRDNFELGIKVDIQQE